LIGTPVTANVSNGTASATYMLPAGALPGAYTIQATFSGTGNFLAATDASHALTIDSPLTGGPLTITAADGVSFTGAVANVADRDTSEAGGDYTATIDWGDGVTTAAGTLSGGAGTFTVLANHTYANPGE